MSEPRVVHIANFDRGMKIHLGNYLRYLRGQGYAVSGITHPGTWLTRDSLILDGIFVKVLPFMPKFSPWTDLATLVRLGQYFRQERVDIVHTHTIKPGLLGRLAARVMGVPIIVHTIHGFIFSDALPPLENQLYAWAERLGAACSSLLLSQSRQDIDLAIQKKICPAEKLAYLGNGIDLTRFNRAAISQDCVSAYRQELGIGQDEKVVGFAGRFEREKGVYEFLAAAQELKRAGVRAKYVMVGASQPQKNSAVSPHEIVRQHHLAEDVLLLGFREDMPELLALMDLVVLPSYHEGIPRILMEGAAFGIPVVATAVRGITEVVVDQVTGLLVPIRDPLALAEAIGSLLEDPARAARIGRSAHQHALSHFDERLFFWKTDREYRRLLEWKLGKDFNQHLKPIPILELEQS